MPQNELISVKRALLSVSNKDGILELANVLMELGVEIISTGGTSKILNQANIPFRDVSALTKLPEMLAGRVKTLHPVIHGGILGKRDQHANEAKYHQIEWIDLVVVNFYPFSEKVDHTKMNWEERVEYIDIGGPTMVRAAAKNFEWVGVVVDPTDYSSLITQLKNERGLNFSFRKQLAQKAFAVTSNYDAKIYQTFLKDNETADLPLQSDTLQLEKDKELRYGENPHQKAYAYRFGGTKSRDGILTSKQFQGKALSYNNILDAEAALACVNEFDGPACVIVKHANPCGVSQANEIDIAYRRAYEADRQSAFGGIIALNRTCSESIASSIVNFFSEVILAPAFTREALAILSTKPNLRVLECLCQPNESSKNEEWEMKFITGGLLIQEKDRQIIQQNDLQVMTKIKPTPADMETLLFAWRVVKHIKSNAILLAKNQTTVGIGAGQVSRIDAVKMALNKASSHLQDTVLASDAFFPFRDSIDLMASTGIRAIIQPGGSLRDEEVIAACNEHQIAMVFTGKRCFRH